MTTTTVRDGWFDDPVARHRLRYWDGEHWTAYVSDVGETSLDELPPPTSPLPRQQTPDAGEAPVPQDVRDRLYCYVARAETNEAEGLPGLFVMPGSDTRLQEVVGQRTGHPGADVVIIQPDEWNPPPICSTDLQELRRTLPEVLTRVMEHRKKVGLPLLGPDELMRKGTTMPNPVSGRIFFVYPAS